MPIYQLELQLLPPRLFGLPDGDWLLAPVGQSAAMIVSLDPGSPVGLESHYRDHDQRLSATLDINGIQIEIDDDRAHVTMKANSLEEALALAVPELQRYCSLVTTFVAPGGHPVTFHITEAFADGAPVLLPRGFNVPGLFYNLEENRSHFLAAADLVHRLPPDPLLDQALSYFMIGEDLHTVVTEKRTHHLWPLCFLQFWKALATIVGDPSRDKDHQSRFRTFGLGTDDQSYYVETIRPLHDIRNQFDVAHLASLDAPQFVLQEDVVRCRRVAAEAIQAYVDWRKSATGGVSG